MAPIRMASTMSHARPERCKIDFRERSQLIFAGCHAAERSSRAGALLGHGSNASQRARCPSHSARLLSHPLRFGEYIRTRHARYRIALSAVLRLCTTSVYLTGGAERPPAHDAVGCSDTPLVRQAMSAALGCLCASLALKRVKRCCCRCCLLSAGSCILPVAC